MEAVGSVSSDFRQYYARPILHLMFLVPMGGFTLLGLLLGIFGQGSDSRAGWLVAGILLLITLPSYWLIWRMRVRLSRLGISVLGPGCKVETNWENLESFYCRPGHAGLVTRGPMTGKGVERLRRYRNLASYQPSYDEAELQWLLEGRYFPLRGFEHIVKKRIIQKAIARHVPDLPGLVADPTAPAPAAGTRAPKLTTSFWIAIGISVVAIGILVIQPQRVQNRAMSILVLIMCMVGSLRMAIAAYVTLRARFRLLGFLYALLAMMLALLCLSQLENWGR
jgi:hypothetical protein